MNSDPGPVYYMSDWFILHLTLSSIAELKEGHSKKNDYDYERSVFVA
jgi:hypothetical protein